MPRKACTMQRFLHVTRDESGEIVSVGSELVISGPMKVYKDGQLIGEAKECRMEIPLAMKPAEGRRC